MDNAFKLINDSLTDDLISEIMKYSPDYFGALVVKLLLKMGYGGSIPSSGVVVAIQETEE